MASAATSVSKNIVGQVLRLAEVERLRWLELAIRARAEGIVAQVAGAGTPMREDERTDRIAELRERNQELDTEAQDRIFTADEQEEYERNAAEIDEHERAIDQIRARREWMERQAGDIDRQERAEFNVPRPTATRDDDIWDLSTVRASAVNPFGMAGELRDRAKRAIERCRPKHPDVDHAEAKRYMEWLVTERDIEDGRLARYMLAVGSPVYKRAFGKYLQYRDSSGMTREEQVAWHAGQQAERAMSLTGAAGGFAVPFELDPTLMNISNGFINPIRAISRVIPISVDEWRGVTWSGVTAAYQPEATAVTEQTPTLAQPSISTEKAQAWVPFSIEVGQDWGGMQAELASAFSEAKDTLESTKFVSGTGTNEPFGVATGTTNIVECAGAAPAFVLADLYALRGALPPRYRAQGRFIADLLIYDRIRQFDTVGSSAAIWVDSLQDDNAARLLGKPAHEASDMPDTVTALAKFLIFGDFSRYVIIERVGLTVEYVPHVFAGATPGPYTPTGQRGLYAFWRNSAKVVDANAFRSLSQSA